MTRTTKALKRLGVAGVVAATIGAGVPAFFATAASAATTTGITLSPDSQAATVNTCVAYTAQITPAEAKTIDVQISQTVSGSSTSPAPAGTIIQFCDPDGAGAGVTATNTTTTATNGDVTSTPGAACPTGTAGTAGTNYGSTVQCDAEFATNANGSVTFGVQSNTVGTVNITAFVEDNPANPGPTPGNATPATGNATGNNVPNVGEPSDTSTLTVVAAGNSSVKAITCAPTTRTANFGTGSSVTYTCTAYTTNPSTGANTLPVTGATLSDFVTSGPDKNEANNCTATANPGESTCTVTNSSGQAGTDNVLVYAEQNGAAGPQATETNTTVTANFVGGARNIACSADKATATVGSEYTVDCLVTDVNGKAVPNKPVGFTLSGVGRFSSLNCYFGNTCGVATGSTGHATVSVTSSTAGTSTVKAELANNTGATFTPDSTSTTSECNSPAGTTRDSGGTAVAAPGSTAGNCDQTVNVNFVQAASPSPSASSSATPTPTATGTTPAGAKPTLSTSTPDIQPNQQGKLTATGTTPNAVYELRCYSRPSTTYFTARTVTAGASDTSVSFTILPGTNTRCYVRPQGDEANASNSVVINVHTSLSLSAYRDGVRQYHFQGTNLPRRSGQLITLYRWARADNNGYCDPHVAANDYTATSTDPNCVAIRTATATTDSSNVWRIDRTFTGSGQFVFMAKTSQNLTNAAGVSNLRLTIIH